MALAMKQSRVAASRTTRAVAVRAPLRVVAQAQKSDKAAVAVTAASFAAVAMAAVPSAAQAANEALQMAEGEPAIVQVGWAATAAVFSFSLALVVWGRSGM